MKRLVLLLCLCVTLVISGYAVDHEATLKALRADIAANGYTFTVKYNPACDIPLDELCTLKPEWAAASDIMLEDSCGVNPESDASMLDLSVTQSAFTGYCGGIRNQGSCGSCWAFGSIAAIEGAFGWICGDVLDLSEKWVLDCNGSGYSCSGGWWYFPSGCTIPEEGGYYSYNARKDSCRATWGDLYRITGAYYVSGYPYPSVTNIKSRIQTYGGVGAAVYVNSAFQYYSSGCFSSCQSASVNHAIYLCGWDDSMCGGSGAWKLKNSWGTGWGENGFMWIKYGCSRVGYAACYATVNCSDAPCN